MTSFDRFERSLPALFDELATPRIPDYYDDVMARTAATRQRPGWTFLERWLPMSTLTQRLAAAPRIPWRLGVAVALLVVAGLIVAIVAGAISNRRPPAYGPAANGQILYVDDLGRIAAGDPVTGISTVLVAGTGLSAPMYSQDGTRFAYLRETTAGKVDIVVVSSDGTGSLRLTDKPMLTPTYVGWSATGDRLLVVDVGQRMLLFDARREAAGPVDLSEQLGVKRVSVGDGYNFRSDTAFRPPAGSEVLFITQENALQAAELDGTGLRTLLSKDSPGVEYSRIKGAKWSPDGTQIVVLAEYPGLPELWHPYVLNADGTGLRPLWPEATDPLVDVNSALWSPDGTQIAFQHWRHHANDGGQDYYPIGIVDVASGQLRDVGETFTNGYVGWQWSPDGTSILEVPGDESRTILIVNAATGSVETAPWQVDQPIDWQRKAR